METSFVLAPLRVVAHVSCELVAPKENRPNEGIMIFNMELSPMASPAFEQGRWGRGRGGRLVLMLEQQSHVWAPPPPQTLGAVGEAEQAAGEMSEELQVHRHRVPVRDVRREGDSKFK